MGKTYHAAATTFSLFLAAAGPAHGLSPAAPSAGPATALSVGAPGSADSQSLGADKAVTAVLLGLAREWVGTWNDKDVDRMQQLHDGGFVYGYGLIGRFIDGQVLLQQLRKENFWGLTYTLEMVEPQVQILSSETALVLFRLVGKSVGPKGERPYSSIFTLVYQKRGNDWKVVHVHDSERPESG